MTMTLQDSDKGEKRSRELQVEWKVAGDGMGVGMLWHVQAEEAMQDVAMQDIAKQDVTWQARRPLSLVETELDHTPQQPLAKTELEQTAQQPLVEMWLGQMVA